MISRSISLYFLIPNPNWNIDYIITGEETFYGSENKVEEAFAGFKDEEGKETFLPFAAKEPIRFMIKLFPLFPSLQNLLHIIFWGEGSYTGIMILAYGWFFRTGSLLARQWQ